MSFLDRFHGKIATVTAQGHLRKADGSEEIRVGAPKRRPQQQPPQVQQQRPVGNNNRDHGSSGSQSMLRQPTKVVQASNDRIKPVMNQPAPPPPVQTQRSPAKYSQQPSPMASPRGKVSARESDYEYYATAQMPGRVRDDYVDAQPPRKALSIGSPDRSVKNSTECRSPREINESRVVTEQDQLAFSRKARPVQYEPCKLSQYKKEKPDGYYELGKLQPDLNTDELVEKRAKKERVKAFSQNLRTINKNAQSKRAPTESSQDTAAPKPKSTREKALAFAKRVPKPKVSDSVERDNLPGSARSSQRKLPAAKVHKKVIDDDSDDDEVSAELLELQRRHEASRAEVDAMTRSG